MKAYMSCFLHKFRVNIMQNTTICAITSYCNFFAYNENFTHKQE